MKEGTIKNKLTPDHNTAYTQAVASGLYAKTSGLSGKYDNVRRYWEDEITRHFLYSYLKRLIARKKQSMERLRILDLGCGSADGYELLMGIRDRDPSLTTMETGLLTPETLGYYKGVDLNHDLLAQARSIYGQNPKILFEQGDFTKGLPVDGGEKPYDLYFTSYGTCSHHNDDRTFIQMLKEIADKTEDYALVVCDWLGRYSYEWQDLWTNNPEELKNMDYVVSYIFPENERQRKKKELTHLTLRLMSETEAAELVETASQLSDSPFHIRQFFDRSVFTGRHMDTGEHNRYAEPIRAAVNSLHETNVRTDLSSLIINYVPKPGFDTINRFMEYLQICWNSLIKYTQKLLDSYSQKNREYTRALSDIPESYPDELKRMMLRMKRVVEGIGWLSTGLPRENIIEPQLGFALRYLMSELQQGRGNAHGLVCVIEIDKKERRK